MHATTKRSFRPAFPLLLLALVILLAALWAGLLRIGWAWPLLRPTLPMAHGPLMVGGFLGTLISLERAVALAAMEKGRWARFTYLAPLCTALGSLLLLVGLDSPLPPLLITLGSLGLLLMMVRIYTLHPALYAAVLVSGAASWGIGKMAWLLGRSVPAVVLWWLAFLVLTIAGERLELSRLLRLGRAAQALFLAGVVLLLAGCLVSLVPTLYIPGVRLAGGGLLLLAGWLLHYDIARRRVRAGGQARFIALALLAGYVWLGISGLLALLYGGATAGPHYDAILHTVFLGFVFSMIFAHSLIIFPAVLGRPLRYRPSFYAPLVLLNLSVVLRVSGDLAGAFALRRWGGLLSALAILLFFATIAAAMRLGSGDAPA